jgi:hypothetical protein
LKRANSLYNLSNYGNAGILSQVKAAVAKDSIVEALHSIDQELVKTAVGGDRFQECFLNNCQDAEIEAYIKSLIA